MKKGEKMSDELKKKLSLAKIGKVFTAKHKANLSKSHLGKMPANIEMLRTYRKGRPLSEAHKNGIGAGNKGKVISKETRLKISIAGVGIHKTLAVCDSVNNAPLAYANAP